MKAPDPQAPKILFVDDEATAVKYFRLAIESLAPVITAESVELGKQALDAHGQTLAVLVSDQRMPGGYGNELLRYARERYPLVIRMLTTAYSELDQTIEAVNRGEIHRYIQKPWEIAALRLEIKQALELADLHREHAELMREKLTVRQNQTIAHRIGTLHVLCASLAGAAAPPALADYLAVAALVGCKPSQPDWRRLDFPDLVAAEAKRDGVFGTALRRALDHIVTADLGARTAAAVDLLASGLAGKVRVAPDGSLLLTDERLFAEYLETPGNAEVSAQHAFWLAFLIGLRCAGWSVAAGRTDSGIVCRLVQSAPAFPEEQLAEWIRRLTEA